MERPTCGDGEPDLGEVDFERLDDDERAKAEHVREELLAAKSVG
jgi:hypothetical protein